jgi:AraC-like DNA-binding protein
MLEDSTPAPRVQRIVPDGRAELIFNLGQPYGSLADGIWKPQPRCFLFGQITGPLLLRSAGPARMIGIRFHPHTAGQLLKVPMSELTDAAVSLDDISMRVFREFKDLEEPRAPLELFAALDRIMLSLEKRSGVEDHLLSAAVTALADASMDVATVANHTGLSARQFERRFRQAVGIPPKLFSRMQRFQGVFPALESGNVGWADAAVRCGYYDQAHLIRDFREFAGKPPAALLAEGTDLARHFVHCESVSHFSKTREDASR